MYDGWWKFIDIYHNTLKKESDILHLNLADQPYLRMGML